MTLFYRLQHTQRRKPKEKWFFTLTSFDSLWGESCLKFPKADFFVFFFEEKGGGINWIKLS